MKRYALLTLCLVLTAALLVGCGCTNQNRGDKNTSAPTVLPTNEEVWNEPTTSATRPTTAATEDTTMPSATIDRGNGALEDTTENGGTGAADGNTATNSTTPTGTAGANGGTSPSDSSRAMPNSR